MSLKLAGNLLGLAERHVTHVILGGDTFAITMVLEESVPYVWAF